MAESQNSATPMQEVPRPPPTVEATATPEASTFARIRQSSDSQESWTSSVHSLDAQEATLPSPIIQYKSMPADAPSSPITQSMAMPESATSAQIVQCLIAQGASMFSPDVQSRPMQTNAPPSPIIQSFNVRAVSASSPTTRSMSQSPRMRQQASHPSPAAHFVLDVRHHNTCSNPAASRQPPPPPQPAPAGPSTQPPLAPVHETETSETIAQAFPPPMLIAAPEGVRRPNVVEHPEEVRHSVAIGGPEGVRG